VPASAEARSPFALLNEVERAREVLILTYTATLEFFERFALADARALGALVTVVSDATMVHPDPFVVRRAGTHYRDVRAVCPRGAFHPKLLIIVGDSEARIAIGSGNLTMAGWHANAEIWTTLRADEDGGPTTLRQLSAFLRELATSDITLSQGAGAAMTRTADQLDELPADDPGPVLLHSLHTPILEQLTVDGPVDELELYAPFHDTALRATNAILDRLEPTAWTVFVQPDTQVDGPALADLAERRRGRVAWASRQTQHDDGSVLPDERYWHGKLVQWRHDNTRWALTGSPNISTPALLRTVTDGNCELALLPETQIDLAPAEGPAPPGGVAILARPKPDEVATGALVLLAATVVGGAVALQLHAPLAAPGILQRYDAVEDRWRTSATLPAGSHTYQVGLAAAPIGQAVRILRDDHATSNSVFVADPERLRRRQEKTIGKVRATPADVARLGLGDQLLADLDQLRAHLLRVGATLPTAGRPTGVDDQPTDSDSPPAARPAPGISLDDYLVACDPVLGQRMTEFALLLPALPGLGIALDDAVGTLDTDEDSGSATQPPVEREPTLTEALRRQTPSERDRYRQFLERLVRRASEYPTIVRNLAAHSVLHAAAVGIWPDDRWPTILADAITALGAAGDEPNEHERDAAASLAAVGLAMLRTDIGKISRRDEHVIRYEAAGRAVAALLPHLRQNRIDQLDAELRNTDPPRQLASAATAEAAKRAVDEILRPPKGAERAARLLADDQRLAASVTGGQIIDLHDPLDGIAEARLLLALSFADDEGPIYVRGRTTRGSPVVAAWCAPWLAIERTGPAGRWGRAWKLALGQTPGMLRWDDLPKATRDWSAGQARPDEIADLLALVD
jgi:hypothetical protein